MENEGELIAFFARVHAKSEQRAEERNMLSTLHSATDAALAAATTRTTTLAAATQNTCSRATRWRARPHPDAAIASPAAILGSPEDRPAVKPVVSRSLTRVLTRTFSEGKLKRSKSASSFASVTEAPKSRGGSLRLALARGMSTNQEKPEAMLLVLKAQMLPLMRDLVTQLYFEVVMVSPISAEVSKSLRAERHQPAAFNVRTPPCMLPVMSQMNPEYGRTEKEKARVLNTVHEDMLADTMTPAALCIAERQPVIVHESFNDKRFGASQAKLGCLAISQLHIPLVLPSGADEVVMDGKGGAVIGVLSLISRVNAFNGRAGIRIDESRDVEMAKAYGEMLVDAGLSHAQKSAKRASSAVFTSCLARLKQQMGVVSEPSCHIREPSCTGAVDAAQVVSVATELNALDHSLHEGSDAVDGGGDGGSKAAV
jgi:hypothetical protein